MREDKESYDMISQRVLIIGGTTKAGTTSIFLYLSDHSQVCTANVKETRFFLDPAYPLPAKYHLEDGLDKYRAYFNHCGEQCCWVEATPDYLYGEDSPRRIRTSLSDVRLVFTLRDPIQRLVSWYRFAKQTSRLESSCTFAQYVSRQQALLKDKAMQRECPQHLRALEQGRYAQYISRYREVFDETEICLLRYETLSAKPEDFMTALCTFAELDPTLFVEYRFKIFNQSRTVKYEWPNRMYLAARQRLRSVVHDKPHIKVVLGKVRRQVEPILLNFSSSQDEQVEIDANLHAMLHDYYSEYYSPQFQEMFLV